MEFGVDSVLLLVLLPAQYQDICKWGDRFLWAIMFFWPFVYPSFLSFICEIVTSVHGVG